MWFSALSSRSLAPLGSVPSGGLPWAFLAVCGLSLEARGVCSAVVVCRLLTVVASLVAERGPGARALQKLQHAGSVVVAHMACGIFPDQGLNPCLLHCKVDS